MMLLYQRMVPFAVPQIPGREKMKDRFPWAILGFVALMVLLFLIMALNPPSDNQGQDPAPVAGLSITTLETIPYEASSCKR